MAESDILQHLLAIEDEASSLVLEAQREADRRQSLSEERERESYERRYAEKSAEFEKAYVEAAAAAKDDYEAELSGCRDELSARPIHEERFRSLADRILFGTR
ncbi:MAG: hypothetical protein A2Z99_19105 [Treponema sp. GWB1_62_6]|nr:MAG: hypothetical protein A2Z99_19105 [Treponema sp. GWB1_62_6]OHE67687.1 MAG: hypothetical protein A2001_19410 [Treponema sp. GWC1_61_84]HCM29062.1 hypothetical protein [Treponema sp.]